MAAVTRPGSLKMIFVSLLGVSALFSASAVNPCLDPNVTAYNCVFDEPGILNLYGCGITDEDVDSGDLVLCLDEAGRENIRDLDLGANAFTTVPEGVFQDLPALKRLNLESNNLTTLPEDIFQNLTTMTGLSMHNNSLTALPEDIFQDTTGLATLNLAANGLAALPEGLFQNLTALTTLYMSNNPLTTLPEDIFRDLTALTNLGLGTTDLNALSQDLFKNLTAVTSLQLNANGLTTVPEGIFHHLTALETLYLAYNDFTILPEGLFQNSTALQTMRLQSNSLVTLPESIFQGLTNLTTLDLNSNDITTLPEGVFQNLTALTFLDVTGNPLECLPDADLQEVDDDATESAEGLRVDSYGDECGCSIADVNDNVCGEETCTTGVFGFTCAVSTASTPSPSLAAISTAPTSAPSLVAISTAPTPASSIAATFTFPTPAPPIAATSTVPTPAPSSNVSSTTVPVITPAEQKSASDSTAVVAGVVAAVAGAALVALAVFVKRRRASKKRNTHPTAFPFAPDHDNLERGRDEPQDVQPPSSTDVRALDHRKTSPRRHMPAETKGVDGGGIAPEDLVQSRAQHGTSSAEHWGAGLTGEDASSYSADKLSTASVSTASAPVPNMSTTERAERAQFVNSIAAAASATGGSGPVEATGSSAIASSATDSESRACEISLGHAVLEAARELAHHCQMPGVGEAATAVCIMVNLVSDSRESDRLSESRLRQCHSIVMALKRAANVAEQM